MTTSKSHIISELLRVLIVQGSIEDCLREDSGCFAVALPSVALLLLKND